MPPLLVTAAIIQQENLTLITRRPAASSYPGYWEFPGGKIEEGESPEQSLERELLEELGVTTAIGDIFGSAFYNYPWGDILLLAYHCRLLQLPIRNLGVAEHRWVSPAQLEAYPMLPADRPLIQKLQDQAGPALTKASSDSGSCHKT